VKRKYLGCLLAVLVLLVFCYPALVLEGRSRKEDRVIFLRRVSPGEEFEIRYIHSVEKIPVVGIFSVVGNGQIRALETRFPSFGPGLPFLSADVTREGGIMRAKASMEPMDTLSFYVSSFTRQELVFKQEQISFASMLRDGDVMVFRVKHCPVGRLLVDYARR
jgi:hypothetical protein